MANPTYAPSREVSGAQCVFCWGHPFVRIGCWESDSPSVWQPQVDAARPPASLDHTKRNQKEFLLAQTALLHKGCLVWIRISFSRGPLLSLPSKAADSSEGVEKEMSKNQAWPHPLISVSALAPQCTEELEQARLLNHSHQMFVIWPFKKHLFTLDVADHCSGSLEAHGTAISRESGTLRAAGYFPLDFQI